MKCQTCGAAIVEYKHGMNHGLVTGLIRLYEHRKPVNIRQLKLTRSAWDNFQKLRYWELVAKYTAPGKDPMKKGGIWTITQLGIDFVTGRAVVPKYVWTFRGERIRYEGSPITIEQADPLYRTRFEYAVSAMPHIDDHGQMEIW